MNNELKYAVKGGLRIIMDNIEGMIKDDNASAIVMKERLHAQWHMLNYIKTFMLNEVGIDD